MSRWSLTAAVIALSVSLLASGGCGKTAPKDAHPTAKASKPADAVETPQNKTAAEAPKRMPELEVSKPKGYQPETAGPPLGTLPEGVGLKVGDKAPDFQALDAKGKGVTLSALLAAKGEVLLVFYRGGW